MKMSSVFSLAVVFASFVVSLCHANVYVSGHADLGVGFEGNNLHLHLHAENTLGLFGGGTAMAGEYEPGDLMIGVPSPSISRPVGSTWDFLAPNAGDSVWFLPQGSNPLKPFLGLGTEELSPADGWTTPLTWTFNSINRISGDNSSFAIWQESAGTVTVFASSLVPTGTGNSWTQAAFSHDHFNFGFTGEGVYDVSLTIRGANVGGGPIAAGTYSDTAAFRFVTGSAIASVPEPSSLGLVCLLAAGGYLRRARRGKLVKQLTESK